MKSRNRNRTRTRKGRGPHGETQIPPSTGIDDSFPPFSPPPPPPPLPVPTSFRQMRKKAYEPGSFYQTPVSVPAPVETFTSSPSNFSEGEIEYDIDAPTNEVLKVGLQRKTSIIPAPNDIETGLRSNSEFQLGEDYGIYDEQFDGGKKYRKRKMKRTKKTKKTKRTRRMKKNRKI